MNKLLIVSTLVCSNLFAATYHVDKNSVSETETGTILAPFKSIQKASQIMIAGDVCYIHEGIYRETINPANSGSAGKYITYTSYNNDKVIVTGTELVTNWELYKGSIYKATNIFLTRGKGNMLYYNSDAQQLARWPNNTDNNPYTFDMLPISTTAASYSDSTISNSRIPAYNWQGGTIFYLGAHGGCSWQRTITSYNSSRQLIYFRKLESKWPFSTHTPTRYENGNRGSFYLMDKLEALDYPGEWYYDNTTKTLYFYAPDGSNPVFGKVEVATRENAVILSKNYVEISNINFHAANIDISGSYNKINNVRIKHGSETLETEAAGATSNYAAIYISGDYNTIDHCFLDKGAANGILNSGNADNTTITNTYVANFNTLGMHISPLISTGKNAKILNCTFDNSARDVTRISGANSEMGYCDVSHGLLSCQDGGLFYITGNSTPINITLHHNWFHEAYSPASLEGRATGVYLDNNSAGYIVHHNVVWNTQWAGLHFNWNAVYNEIYNNSFWNVGNNEPLISSWVPLQNGVRTNVANNKLYNNISDVRVWWESSDNTYTTDEMTDNDFRNNFQFQNSPFVSVANKNFMPADPITLVDKGIEVNGITNGFSGLKPDLGAYEYGQPYWVPGIDWTPSTFDWDVSTSVGVNKLLHNQDVSIKCNAVQKRLEINVLNRCVCRIFSATGKLLAEQQLEKGVNHFSNTNFPKGIYVVSVSDGNELLERKKIVF